MSASDPKRTSARAEQLDGTVGGRKPGRKHTGTTPQRARDEPCNARYSRGKHFAERGVHMDFNAITRSSSGAASLSIEAIQLAVNVALSECVCHVHLRFCLLTASGERAGIQPFLYEPDRHLK
jgi:hypothetical protein